MCCFFGLISFLLRLYHLHCSLKGRSSSTYWNHSSLPWQTKTLLPILLIPFLWMNELGSIWKRIGNLNPKNNSPSNIFGIYFKLSNLSYHTKIQRKLFKGWHHNRPPTHPDPDTETIHPSTIATFILSRMTLIYANDNEQPCSKTTPVFEVLYLHL